MNENQNSSLVGNSLIVNVTEENNSSSSEPVLTSLPQVSIVRSGGSGGSGSVTEINTGVGLIGGPITTTGTIKAKLKSETPSSLASGNPTQVANKQYAVGVDKDGYLSVNVPWDDSDKVKQTPTTTNNTYEVLFSQSADNIEHTEYARKSSSLTYNPSTHALTTGGPINGYTLAAAAAKGVDTSISEGSTSQNLPTSEAVAKYIEDQGFSPSDTTYTFTGGTNQFTALSSQGRTQTVTITPSIANNITGTGQNGSLAQFNGANSIIAGPTFGSDTTLFLRNDGTWDVPEGDQNVQADWNETDLSSDAYIQNKPYIPENVSDLNNDTGFITASDDITGNAATASQLTTPHSISIEVGATGAATYFDGSNDISIPVTNVKEAYISWGGQGLTNNNISPSDMGCIDDFGHNKLAYLPGECLDVAYSTDGGATWIDSGLTNADKIKMMTTSGSMTYSGGSTVATEENVTDLQLRIRLATCFWYENPQTHELSFEHKLYTAAKKILFNVTDPGANAIVNVARYRTIANYRDNVDSWTDVSGVFDVRGGPGWNSIPFIYTFGGFSNQTSQIGQFEFIFSNTQLGTWGQKKVGVSDIRLIGTSNWTMPSELAKNGHLYTIDTSQNASFPGSIGPKVNSVNNLGSSSYKWANVYATNFNGQLNGTITSNTTAVTQESTDNSTKIATTAFVKTAIDNMPEPVIYKGTLASDGSGTKTDLPTPSADNEGWMYKVKKAGTYAGQVSKEGDTFICAKTGTNTYEWTYIPSADDLTLITAGYALKVRGSEDPDITTTGTLDVDAEVSNSGYQKKTYLSYICTGTEQLNNTYTFIYEETNYQFSINSSLTNIKSLLFDIEGLKVKKVDTNGQVVSGEYDLSLGNDGTLINLETKGNNVYRIYYVRDDGFIVPIQSDGTFETLNNVNNYKTVRIANNGVPPLSINGGVMRGHIILPNNDIHEEYQVPTKAYVDEMSLLKIVETPQGFPDEPDEYEQQKLWLYLGDTYYDGSAYTYICTGSETSGSTYYFDYTDESTLPVTTYNYQFTMPVGIAAENTLSFDPEETKLYWIKDTLEEEEIPISTGTSGTQLTFNRAGNVIYAFNAIYAWEPQAGEEGQPPVWKWTEIKGFTVGAEMDLSSQDLSRRVAALETFRIYQDIGDSGVVPPIIPVNTKLVSNSTKTEEDNYLGLIPLENKVDTNFNNTKNHIKPSLVEPGSDEDYLGLVPLENKVDTNFNNVLNHVKPNNPSADENYMGLIPLEAYIKNVNDKYNGYLTITNGETASPQFTVTTPVSSQKINITNTMLYIKSGNDAIVSIDNEKASSPYLEATETLAIGNFAFVKKASGHVSLKKIK